MEDRKQIEREGKGHGTGNNLQRHDLSHLLLVARSHLLEFPEQLKIASQAWD
jgi:hypothetical protein